MSTIGIAIQQRRIIALYEGRKAALMSAAESQAAGEPSALVAIAVAETDMSQHLTRARLYRSVIGAIFTMILCATALFTSALHFAG
jgi:hypothetical protein